MQVTPLEGSPERRLLLEEVRRFLSEHHLAIRDLGPRHQFSQLGVSSQLLVQLVARCNEVMPGKGSIPSALTDVRTIGDLMDLYTRTSDLMSQEALDSVQARALRRRGRRRG